MTADDFFLVSITFGGFLIFAFVLWSFARMADRKQGEKRGPDNRPDVEPPSASNGHGRNEESRSGRAKDFLRRLVWQTRPAIGRHIHAPTNA